MSDYFKKLILCIRCPEMKSVPPEEIIIDLAKIYGGPDIFAITPTISCLKYAGSYLPYWVLELSNGLMTEISLPLFFEEGKFNQQSSFANYINSVLFLWNAILFNKQGEEVRDTCCVFAVMPKAQAILWERYLGCGEDMDDIVNKKRELLYIKLTFTFFDNEFVPRSDTYYPQ